MKFMSWNVNGIRAAQKKGFLDWLDQAQPDVLGLQEIKARPDQLDEELLAARGYHVAWNPAERPGYSGVATFSKRPAKAVELGFGIPEFDSEGRVVITTHGVIDFYNVYFPNGGASDERLAYKLAFYDALRDHANARVETGAKVIVSGDWNTAHRDIDLARPKPNRKKSGFMPIECESMDRWFQDNWTDSFRHFYPEKKDAYSWWAMRSGARERNVGWRLDYHMVSHNLKKRLAGASILTDVLGSDHCPVLVEIK